MEIPFLKNKNKLGSGIVTIAVTSDHTSDQALIDSVADELLEAIEKKDIKRLRESLQALVLSIRDRDESSDE